MKNRTRLSLSILSCITSFIVKSQDTIYFKNNAKLSLVIVEVGIDTIKYKLNRDSNSVIYSLNKNTIQLIKFSNGSVDSISTSTPEFYNEKYFDKNKSIQKIEIDGKKLIIENCIAGLFFCLFPLLGIIITLTVFNQIKKYGKCFPQENIKRLKILSFILLGFLILSIVLFSYFTIIAFQTASFMISGIALII